jgi:hypothetical protein
MTTADWLRYAANMWTEVDATEDRDARRVKLLLAEGYERLAKHAAYLADDGANSLVGRPSGKRRYASRWKLFKRCPIPTRQN